jgi:hypothetical protein
VFWKSGLLTGEEEIDMHDGMYSPDVYAFWANDWLKKAEATVHSQGLEVARLRIEGAKVYAKLAEVACNRERAEEKGEEEK